MQNCSLIEGLEALRLLPLWYQTANQTTFLHKLITIFFTLP